MAIIGGNPLVVGQNVTVGSASVAVTLTTVVPAGGTVVVFSGMDGSNSQLSGVVDSKGNTYTLGMNVQPLTGPGNMKAAWSVAITNALAVGDTVTGTWASATGMHQLIAVSVSGASSVAAEGGNFRGMSPTVPPEGTTGNLPQSSGVLSFMPFYTLAQQGDTSFIESDGWTSLAEADAITGGNSVLRVAYIRPPSKYPVDYAPGLGSFYWLMRGVSFAGDPIVGPSVTNTSTFRARGYPTSKNRRYGLQYPAPNQAWLPALTNFTSTSLFRLGINLDVDPSFYDKQINPLSTVRPSMQALANIKNKLADTTAVTVGDTASGSTTITLNPINRVLVNTNLVATGIDPNAIVTQIAGNVATLSIPTTALIPAGTTVTVSYNLTIAVTDPVVYKNKIKALLTHFRGQIGVVTVENEYGSGNNATLYEAPQVIATAAHLLDRAWIAIIAQVSANAWLYLLSLAAQACKEWNLANPGFEVLYSAGGLSSSGTKLVYWYYLWTTPGCQGLADEYAAFSFAGANDDAVKLTDLPNSANPTRDILAGNPKAYEQLLQTNHLIRGIRNTGMPYACVHAFGRSTESHLQLNATQWMAQALGLPIISDAVGQKNGTPSGGGFDTSLFTAGQMASIGKRVDAQLMSLFAAAGQNAVSFVNPVTGALLPRGQVVNAVWNNDYATLKALFG